MSLHHHPRRARRAPLALLLAAAIAVAAAGATRPSIAAPSPAELEAARDRLLELERSFELVVERYNATEERLTAIQAEVGRIDASVGELERRIDSRQRAAAELAAELYKAGPTGNMEEVLASASFAEIDSRLEYLRSSQTAQTKVFQSLADDARALDRNIAALEDRQAQAMAAKERLEELRQEVESRLASQRDEVVRLNRLVQAAERRQRLREEREEREAALAAAEDQATESDARSGEGPVPAPAPAPNSRAEIAVRTALDQVGDPYVWAAEGPDTFDCSGLTLYAWARAGVSLPHNSGMQYDATPRVARSDWQPGDLLFFGSPIHHVSMYIGDGKMVEAPYTGAHVRVVSAYRSDYVGAGRPGV